MISLKYFKYWDKILLFPSIVLLFSGCNTVRFRLFWAQLENPSAFASLVGERVGTAVGLQYVFSSWSFLYFHPPFQSGFGFHSVIF